MWWYLLSLGGTNREYEKKTKNDMCTKVHRAPLLPSSSIIRSWEKKKMWSRNVSRTDIGIYLSSLHYSSSFSFYINEINRTIYHGRCMLYIFLLLVIMKQHILFSFSSIQFKFARYTYILSRIHGFFSRNISFANVAIYGDGLKEWVEGIFFVRSLPCFFTFHT